MSATSGRVSRALADWWRCLENESTRGAKKRRRNLRVLVWCHTLHDVTGVQWNTTNTICAIEGANISHLRTRNVCSIPQCFAKSTQEIKLNRSEHCLPTVGIYFDQIVWNMNYSTDEHFFGLHPKNNHCTKQQRSLTVSQTFCFVITDKRPWLLKLK
jgi:hypothetical protein